MVVSPLLSLIQDQVDLTCTHTMALLCLSATPTAMFEALECCGQLRFHAQA